MSMVHLFLGAYWYVYAFAYGWCIMKIYCKYPDPWKVNFFQNVIEKVIWTRFFWQNNFRDHFQNMEGKAHYFWVLEKVKILISIFWMISWKYEPQKGDLYHFNTV
jgi:hypothetical protein